MTTFKPIDTSISRGHQDVTLKKTFTLGEHKVRFVLKSDSYRSQCFALAEVWSAALLKWNEIASLRGEEMKTADKLCHLPNQSGVHERHFAEDLARLQMLVKATLE